MRPPQVPPCLSGSIDRFTIVFADGVGIFERSRLFCLRLCSLEAVFRASPVTGALAMSGVAKEEDTLEEDEGVAIKLLRAEVVVDKG